MTRDPAPVEPALTDIVLGRLLDGAVEVEVPWVGRDPIGWPGYTARPAVRVVRLVSGPVAAVWDFSTYGGSFGEDDATALVAAADLARTTQVPLLTVVRSGGTRLQEGMAALVGIPRARIALLALADARLPHLSVADQPTTGGVWISVVGAADLRVAVAGATVGFAGPRVVEAMTGVLPEGSHTAETALSAGLVDAVLEPADVPGWLRRALTALTADPVDVSGPLAGDTTAMRRGSDTTAAHGESDTTAASGGDDRPAIGGWEQVQRSRSRGQGGADLLAALLTERVDLRGADDTVAACLGRFGGRPVVGVAVAAQVGVRPSPAGYRLASRAYRLADRLGLPVLSLVDNPGADPSSTAENGGIATAMGETLDALLLCRTPTVAVVHGDGGSGGALATAATDVVLLTPQAWFAAIGPDGAAAALRRPAQECADLLRVTPGDLLALGAADALVADPADALWHLAQLMAQDPMVRREARWARWSAPLPGRLPPL